MRLSAPSYKGREAGRAFILIPRMEVRGVGMLLPGITSTACLSVSSCTAQPNGRFVSGPFDGEVFQ